MSVPKPRSIDRQDQSVQVNCLLTNGEKLFLKKAIQIDDLDSTRSDGGEFSFEYFEKLGENLQEETERLNIRNEILKKDIERKEAMYGDLKIQEADFQYKEKQLNNELKEVISHRESVLESIKQCENNIEKTKEKLHHMEQIQRIVMEENIGIQRQWLVDKQELSSAVTDVHDRIIQALNSLLLKESLTEENAAKIRKTMDYFTFMNMKNCLIPQLISLELDSRELEIEQERLANRNSFIRKRIEKLERKEEEGEVSLRSSECSQDLVATQLYQRLSGNKHANRLCDEFEPDTRGANSELTLSNRENENAVRRDASFSSPTEKERKKYLRSAYKGLNKKNSPQLFSFIKNEKKTRKSGSMEDASLLIKMSEETTTQ